MAQYKVSELAYEFPSGDLTALDGYRVLSVDLNNGRQMYDLEIFRQMERNTSWYDELGSMPTHMLIVVDAARAAVIIYNRKTNIAWATFTTSSGNFLEGASTTIHGVDFLDGVMAIVDDTNGIQLIDFIRDQGYAYTSAGLLVRNGDIADRNGALGSITVNTIVQLNHDDVLSVSMVRDVDDQYQEYDIARTLPDILISCDDEVSLIKARDHASGEPIICDSGISTITGLDGVITPDGNTFAAYSDATNDKVGWWLTANITSDTWPAAKATLHQGATDGNIIPVTSGAVISMVDAIPAVSSVDGLSPVIGIATDEGLAIKHLNAADEEDSVTFFFDSIAAHPPLAGKAILKDSWWLGSVDGLLGKTLTNNNSVTFAAAVTGNGAVFTDGGALGLSRVADTDLDVDTDDFSIGWYFKSTSGANPAVQNPPFPGGL